MKLAIPPSSRPTTFCCDDPSFTPPAAPPSLRVKETLLRSRVLGGRVISSGAALLFSAGKRPEENEPKKGTASERGETLVLRLESAGIFNYNESRSSPGSSRAVDSGAPLLERVFVTPEDLFRATLRSRSSFRAEWRSPSMEEALFLRPRLRRELDSEQTRAHSLFFFSPFNIAFEILSRMTSLAKESTVPKKRFYETPFERWRKSVLL